MTHLHLLVAVLGTCFLLTSPVYSKVNIEDFFPFGVEHSDSTVPPADDTFAGPVALRHPFSFFNNSQGSLFVNNNGAISFAEGVRQYTATCGALPARLSMIAPFWADIHNAQGLGGAVYYRETTDRDLLQKAAREIQTAFPNLWGLTIGWLFITTWHDAPFYGANGCYTPNDPNIPRNTFQSILATDGHRSFAIFYYNQITWTTGTASGSGDKCTGLGGQPAKAGFDIGDGKTFYEVPGSCAAGIVDIDDQSNIDAPGKFIFRVDNTFESTTCDSEKYKNERLQISPSFVTVFGHVPLTLKGPCLNSSMTITCQFNDPAQQPVHVTGIFQSVNNTPSAVCVVPHLYSYGRITVDMIVTYRDSVTKYSGFIYVTEPEEQVQVEVEPIDTGKWSITLNWDSAYFPQPTGGLTLVLLEYREESKTWREHIVSDSNIENTGTAAITIDPVEVSSFIAFSLRMRLPGAENGFTGFYKGASSRLLCAEALLTLDNDGACQAWYEEDGGPPRDVLPCPPLQSQAIQDERFEIDEAIGSTLEYFHPEAEVSFRQRTASPSGAGQQCTYKNGQLFLGPMGGGTADAVSPTKSVFEHWLRDVVPWCRCCKYSDRSDSCRKYYDKRPSDTGINYIPPATGRGNGEPHISTFDLVAYTFNGVGEFWMIKSNTFSMQARMEQYADPSGRLTPASVFTAFVMKDTKVVQVQLSQSNDIDILLDGELVSFNAYDHKYRNLYTSTVTITLSEDASRVTVSLASGYSFTFISVENSLSVIAMSSDTNKGTTQGLLGVFDGNPGNDLQSPDGSVILPSASLRDIHYNFGLKWMIKSDESLFTYPSGKGYGNYANPNFEPNFVMPDLNTLPQQILDMCQTSMDCFYDYATTGSISLANQTRQLEKEFNTTVKELTKPVKMCPIIDHPAKGYMNMSSLFAGAEATFECEENFILSGSQKLTCGNENKWSGQAPTCVEVDLPEEGGSPEKEICQSATGLFSDPMACHSYYFCSGGTAYPKECPGRLHFSASLKTCLRAEIAKCVKIPVTTEGPVTHPPATPRPPVTTLRPGFECPQANGLFPNPHDCGSFYNCAHGVAHFTPCPVNLHFSPTLKVCNWPINAGCTVGR